MKPANYLLTLIYLLPYPIALARTFAHTNTSKLLSLLSDAIFLISKRCSAVLIIWIRGSLRCVALTPAMGIVAHLGSLFHRFS